MSLLQLKKYREKSEYKDEGSTTPSSSSSGETWAILGTLSSPSSLYHIHSTLGEGCFGKVTKCTKVSTRETVAVKIMQQDSRNPGLHEVQQEASPDQIQTPVHLGANLLFCPVSRWPYSNT